MASLPRVEALSTRGGRVSTRPAWKVEVWQWTRVMYPEWAYSTCVCFSLVQTMPVCSLELNPSFS